jgi:hypothetical protein
MPLREKDRCPCERTPTAEPQDVATDLDPDVAAARELERHSLGRQRGGEGGAGRC